MHGIKIFTLGALLPLQLVLSLEISFPPGSIYTQTVLPDDTSCHQILSDDGSEDVVVTDLDVATNDSEDVVATIIGLYLSEGDCKASNPFYLIRLVPQINIRQFYSISDVAVDTGVYSEATLPQIKYWKQILSGSDSPEYDLVLSNALELGGVMVQLPNNGGWDKDDDAVNFVKEPWSIEADPNTVLQKLRSRQHELDQGGSQANEQSLKDLEDLSGTIFNKNRGMLYAADDENKGDSSWDSEDSDSEGPASENEGKTTTENQAFKKYIEDSSNRERELKLREKMRDSLLRGSRHPITNKDLYGYKDFYEGRRNLEMGTPPTLLTDEIPDYPRKPLTWGNNGKVGSQAQPGNSAKNQQKAPNQDISQSQTSEGQPVGLNLASGQEEQDYIVVNDETPATNPLSFDTSDDSKTTNKPSPKSRQMKKTKSIFSNLGTSFLNRLNLNEGTSRGGMNYDSNELAPSDTENQQGQQPRLRRGRPSSLGLSSLWGGGNN